MSSVFSGKSLRVSVWLGVALAVLAFAAVSWSDTEQNVDAGERTVIAMRASGAANPCAAENPCNPCDSRVAQNACNPCAAANPCNPCAAANPCNPCNPCASANPCNPCAAANPCNPCNPCAAANPCNPCAAANPCNPCAAANPCNPCNPCGAGGKIDSRQVLRPSGTGLHAGLTQLELLVMGEALWNDRSLSTNGLACGVCHQGGGNFADTFAEPYPHRVKMPHQMAGVDKVAMDEMIQFCMLAPMAAEPLPWDSPELAALTLYGTVEVQRNFIKTAANPCNPCAAANPCNPCAAANPCNPCAASNPCNPCAAANPCNPCNPCGAANPCNPCAAVAAANPCNPCAAANPCNPCAAANPCNPCNPCAGGNE